MQWSADLAKRRFGKVLDDAEECPVHITWHGRRRYVLLNFTAYKILTDAWEAQREKKTLIAVETALGKLLAGEEVQGMKLLRLANSRMAREHDKN